ncbi:MAG: peptidoglycan DD-metalloendopeptidase family protein [Oscillospiraceae bacterium]|nr:peptidoglycan DD-metalloendopeptidase family protein [Oscillospiraceae bacterium]
MKSRKSVKIICLVLAILMVLTLFTGIVVHLADARSLTDIDREIGEARSQINNLEGRRETIDDQLSELGDRLQELRVQEDAYLQEVAILQDQLQLLEERITLTEEQIAIYQQMILDKEQRLEEAIAREYEQFELYRLRIRTMEEQGHVSYIQILLGARSFGDLVARMHDAGEIMNADQRIAEALERYRVAVGAYKEELLSDREELEILIAQLEAEHAALEIERANLQRLIEEIEARIEANEIEFAALEEEKDRISVELAARSAEMTTLSAERQAAIAELERQAAAGGNPGGGGMGGEPARRGTGHFVWPSDFTTNVTSGFGPRARPGGFGSSNHRGIDIAAAGIYGTNILAAASGVVTFAGWNGGFGNVVMISHGNGYSTVYAHNSRNLVSNGQNVVQGQVIALVGSTGASTGPHIHFEIIRNGVHVNPMLYFT